MRIMTTNIWGDYFNNPVDKREKNIYNVYKKNDPDIIGLQEITGSWYKSNLFKWLSKDYNFVGTEIYGNKNYVPMAIKKEYEVIAKGYERFTDTPDDSKSVTWAVLKGKDGKLFGVCNTHFWWMRGSEPEDVKRIMGVQSYTLKEHCGLRSANARQLSELMSYLYKRYLAPVFAFGDMNATIDEGIFDVYEEFGIKKLYDMTEEKDTVCSVHGDPICGEDGLFYGKRATVKSIGKFRQALGLPEMNDAEGYFSSIDHIVALGDGFKVIQYRVSEDRDALDVSDHSPVWTDIEWMQ